MVGFEGFGYFFGGKKVGTRQGLKVIVCIVRWSVSSVSSVTKDIYVWVKVEMGSVSVLGGGIAVEHKSRISLVQGMILK